MTKQFIEEQRKIARENAHEAVFPIPDKLWEIDPEEIEKLDEEIFKVIDTLISQAILATEEEMFKMVEKRKENFTDHICRFNDTPQKCECYNQALTDLLSTLTTEKEI